MIEEGEDTIRREVVKRELIDRSPCVRGKEKEEQTQSVCVCPLRVRAGASDLSKILTEKRLDQSQEYLVQRPVHSTLEKSVLPIGGLPGQVVPG